MTSQLGVFAKYWQPGAVKTRLAAAIGAEPASMLYRCFVETTLRRFQDTAERRWLTYWPPERRRDFTSLAGVRWELRPQVEGDLGQRIESFFRAALSDGAASVVLIGTDSPTLPSEYLEQAYDLLGSGKQAVLGPSEDGGYYLVGLRSLPDIFRGIAWSTDQVWAQTIRAIERAKIDYGVLPRWYDVDDVSDLRRLANELGAGTQSELYEQLSQRIASTLAS